MVGPDRFKRPHGLGQRGQEGPLRKRPPLIHPPRTPVPDGAPPSMFGSSRPLQSFRIPLRTSSQNPTTSTLDSFGYVSSVSSYSFMSTDDDQSSLSSFAYDVAPTFPTVCINDPDAVPLSQFVYPLQGKQVELVASIDGRIDEESVRKAAALCKSLTESDLDRVELVKDAVGKMVERLQKQDQLPLVIFADSDTECEDFLVALQERNMVSLNLNEAELKLLKKRVASAMVEVQRPSESEEWKQLKILAPYFRRGISLITKDMPSAVVQLVVSCFKENLVKVLIMSSSHSLKVDFNARSVLITSARVTDGPTYRLLTSCEYYNMARLAGREELDDFGMVVLMVQHEMSEEDIVELIQCKLEEWEQPGALTRLKEKIVEVGRVYTAKRKDEILQSFIHFKTIPRLTKSMSPVFAFILVFFFFGLSKARREFEDYSRQVQNDHATFEELDQLDKKENSIMKIVKDFDKFFIPSLRPCQVIRIESSSVDYGYVVLLDLKKMKKRIIMKVAFFVYQETECNDFTKLRPYDWNLPREQDRFANVVVAFVSLDCLRAITDVTIRCPHNLDELEGRRTLVKVMRDFLTKSRWEWGLPEIDPIGDMKIFHPDLQHYMWEKQNARKQLRDGVQDRTLLETMKKWWRKKNLKRALEDANGALEKAKGAAQLYQELSHSS